MKAHKNTTIDYSNNSSDAIFKTELELVKALGGDLEIDVKLDEVIPEKHEFTVSASIYGLNEPLRIKKRGKSLRDLLEKLKKSVLKKTRTFASRKIAFKRRNRKPTAYKGYISY